MSVLDMVGNVEAFLPVIYGTLGLGMAILIVYVGYMLSKQAVGAVSGGVSDDVLEDGVYGSEDDFRSDLERL